jgi:tRNA (mo5U34)-methyltransferase
VQTAPNHFLGDYPAVKWRSFEHALPHSLDGLTVLDVGCNAGFYSIEMKRRGARQVVGVDTDARYLAQARFAAEVSGVAIELQNLSVYELPTLAQRFDIVLFMGVLYHLRHPLLALDILHEFAVGDLLVFQSMLRGNAECREFERDYAFEERRHFDDSAYPRMHFVEHKYAGDPTNWWVPNRAAAAAMLRSSGFAIADNPEEEVFICRRQPQHHRRGHQPTDRLARTAAELDERHEKGGS